MQTSGQFGVPPPEAPPQYNPVNNNMNHTNSNNNSSRATSTPGSNQTLGHILFNLSNQDHHVPLSQSSTFTTNPSPVQAHPTATPGEAGPKLVASQTHHENPQFSHFLHAPASSAPPLEHVLQPDHCTSMEWASDEVQQPQQQTVQGNSASSVLPANTNGAKTMAPRPPTFPATISPVQGHNNPATMPPTVLPGSGSGSAPSHKPDRESLDNGEGLQEKAEAMHLQHHDQLSEGLDEAVINLPASEVNSRERQTMHADPLMSLADMDQADEGACAGNRWPRQETIALLKIRADMDAAFRDTSVKRPLWDEVSRKLGELGYERSAKKCKEKFENVNKYYKRTKEGKVGRQDGKNYRFFTQLEALHAAASTSSALAAAAPPAHYTSSSFPQPNIMTSSSNMLLIHTSTTSSDPLLNLQASAPASSLRQISALAGTTPSDTPIVATQPQVFPSSAVPQPAFQLPAFMNSAYCPPHLHGNMGTTLHSSSESSSSSDNDEDEDDDAIDDADDATDDDGDNEHRSSSMPPPDPPHALSPATDQSKKRKRRSPTSMMAFFEGLLKRVIDKQEQMQQKFLQAMEKRESDRMIREEAWRRQEMARLSKEHELRAQERSSAAARDAALIAFLQKVTGQTLDLPSVSMSMQSLCVPIAAQPMQSAPPLHQENALHRYEDHDASDPSSKRWLKPEVLHLIELHSSLQAKFTEAGPKGPLWEEIANGMAKKGYTNRTAKRCKEKWENINKYFKRAKESSKKRPENAKTCPYFHELDALYRRGSSSSNNGNQLAYKPSIEQAQDIVNAAHDQPSTTHHGEGDMDGRRYLQMQPTNVPSERAAVLDVSNANGPDASNVSDAMRNVSSSNGNFQSIASMQLSMDAFRSFNNAPSTPEHTMPRSGFSAELGLSIQQQSSPLDICQHKPASDQIDFGNVEAEGDLMPSTSVAQTELHSCSAKESKPSLAPLPNSTSFMANMLQKLSNNNTSASNDPQDQ
ncbi:hypothetical protein GOP47_0019481 [Adiantum capillus-veneris]|uniref:Myb-like domain-containing protein n=1 Tax=Adiantum capillus-veneris TaxID=13818 RepID=A0A9D4UCW1_ADICA|nr:hypothetical protein GOP47_0019481 [Adiantum capillus-veneris]